MVETVARAIAGADDEDYMEDHARYDRRARAAIAAMRKPTKEMFTAADAEEAVHRPPRPRLTWTAMIDAALSAPQGSEK